MFVLKQSDTFKWPVKFMLPSADMAGKFDQNTVTLEFKRLPQSKIQSMVDADGVSDIGVAREIVVGWEGVVDDEKQPVPFSPSGLDMFLDMPMVAATVVTAYMEAVSGGAKRKN